jgi:hypothetical protein
VSSCPATSLPADSLFHLSDAVIADVATAAVQLFIAGLEYVDLFTHLVMWIIPTNAPNADGLLGSVPSSGKALLAGQVDEPGVPWVDPHPPPGFGAALPPGFSTAGLIDAEQRGSPE